MAIRTIFTRDAPTPAGHYSQAVLHNETLYVAGLLAIDKDGVKHFDAPAEEQTRMVFRNLEIILKSSGSSLQKLLSVTIYVSNISDWAVINKEYSNIMGTHKPARTIVPVPELHYGLKLEVQAIASL
jgi:reactive intermediate/imine deaminase